MNNKDIIPIGGRLLAVAEYIREGAVLCDVGTDHAKLPIYLAAECKIKKAYATDINEGPIRTAQKNVRRLGLSEVIECIRTDGLANTHALGITDISVCGMGGELIARILSECEYIRDEGINLILQPMSHTEDLRRFLFDSGFSIDDEMLVKETGKLYTVINAHYTGETYVYTDVDLMIGKILPGRRRDALFSEMVDRVLYHLENKQKSTDTTEVQRARKLYDEIKEEIG